MMEIATTRHGRMICSPNDQYVGEALIKYGEYAEGEIDIFRDYVKEGDVVLDIGAHIGSHTIALSKMVGKKGQVLAFEPQWFLYFTLCGNTALNECFNTRVFQAACGAKPGPIKIPSVDYEVSQNFGGIELGRVKDGYMVRQLCIDEMQLQRVDFIKIDVEGMEKDVLMGAQQTIMKYRPTLFIEDDRKEKSKMLHALLLAYEYDIKKADVGLYSPENFNGCKDNIYGDTAAFNLLCTPKKKEDSNVNNAAAN